MLHAHNARQGLVAKDKLHVSYHGQALNKSMAEVCCLYTQMFFEFLFMKTEFTFLFVESLLGAGAHELFALPPSSANNR